MANGGYGDTERFLLVALFGALLLLAGCTEPHAARVATRMLSPVSSLDEREGDPAALAAIKSVAILPFDNLAGDKSFDPLRLAQKVANQMASQGELRVIYPQEALRRLEEVNDQIREHNDTLRKLELLGRRPSEERRARSDAGLQTVATGEDVYKDPLDPVRRLPDAVQFGRLLQVDAVLMGTVTDYTPYYRPRVALSAQAVLTGRSDTATEALRALTQQGIPRSILVERGVAWMRQQVFDANDGGTARDLYLFARNHHTEEHPYDTEIYLRSMDRYFEFVGATLSDRLLAARDAAVKEMLDRARAEAKKRHESDAAVVARITALTDPTAALPPAAMVISENLPDRRDRSWRADEQGLGSGGEPPRPVPADTGKKRSTPLFWRR